MAVSEFLRTFAHAIYEFTDTNHIRKDALLSNEWDELYTPST